MIRLLILIIALIPSVSFAWSEEDTQRQLTYTTLHVIDWGQTLDIAESEEYYETNPILGRNPTRGEVNRYFLLTGLAHYGISRMLPPKHRKWWQRATIAVESGIVSHNIMIGVNIQF